MLLQHNDEWLIKIDHKRGRKWVIYSVTSILIWFIMKAVFGYRTRHDEIIDYVHVLSLLSSFFCTNVITIIVSCHFTFFIAVLSDRFCNFVKNFEQNINLKDDDDLIEALDGFIFSYSTFESLIEKINAIFCLQVIDQLMFSTNFYFQGFSSPSTQIIFTLIMTLSSSIILIFAWVFHVLRVESTSSQLIMDIGATAWTLDIIIPMVFAIYVASSIKERVRRKIYHTLQAKLQAN